MRTQAIIISILAITAGMLTTAFADNRYVFRSRPEVIMTAVEEEAPETGRVPSSVPVVQNNLNWEFRRETDTPPLGPILFAKSGPSQESVGASRIVYQCFSASGGYGNYTYTIDASASLPNWAENADVVSSSNLSAPFGDYQHQEFLPRRTDTDGNIFSVANIGTACIRIKVKEVAAGEQFSSGNFGFAIELKDFRDDQLVTTSPRTVNMMTSEQHATISWDVYFTAN